MDSEAERKRQKSVYAPKKGRVVEDERGRQIWQDTIRHVKLKLMKTGVFYMSKAQERLLKLRATGTINASNDLDEELEIFDDKGSFDPYDSAKK